MPHDRLIERREPELTGVLGQPKVAMLVLEVITFLCLAIALHVWAAPRIEELPVHPFLVIVALFTVQYGTIGGIIATVVATGIKLAGSASARVIGQDYFSYNLTVWADPLSWLGIALLLGLIVDRYLQSIEKLASGLERKTIEFELVSKHHAVLTDRVHRLERCIAGFTDVGAPELDGMAGGTSDMKRTALHMQHDGTD